MSNLTITQVDTGATITVAVPGSISGPAGPQGPSGVGAATTFIYTQTTAAAVWTINHGLNRFPAVAVVDSAGTWVEGDIQYTSANEIVLTFAGAFSGDCYLN